MLCGFLFTLKGYAAEPEYSVNPNNYIYSMTLTGVLTIEGVESYDANDVVYAFIDGTCRGVAQVKQVQSINRGLCFLMIYSNDPAGTITFKVYDSSEDVLYSLDETQSYGVNKVVGSVSEPHEFIAHGIVYEADLLSFSFLNQLGETVISYPKVYIDMPYAADFTSLTPQFELSAEASASVDGQIIESGVTVLDFEETIHIQVDSKDGGQSKSYTIKLRREENELRSLTISNAKVNENSIGVAIGEMSAQWKYGTSSKFTCVDQNFFFIDETLYVTRDCLNYETASTYTLRVGVDDGYETYYEDLTIEVLDVNEAPTSVELSVISVDRSLEVGDLVGSISAQDVDEGDVLSFMLSADSQDQQYFSIDGDQLLLNVSIKDVEQDVLLFSIVATDQAGASFEQLFELNVSNSNLSPKFESTSQTAVIEGDAYLYSIVCSDPEGDSLSYEVLDLPGWLTFDESLFIISGIPTSSDLGAHSFTIVVSDSYHTVEQEVTLFVIEVNNAPQAVSTIDDVVFVSNETNIYQFDENLFEDEDGDLLSYELTLINGEPLPDWLLFTERPLGMEATPSDADVGTYQLKYTASDASNLYASLNFELRVEAAQLADTLTPLVDQVLDVLYFEAETEQTYYLPEDLFNEQQGGALTYTLSLEDGGPLPNWIDIREDSLLIIAEPLSDHLGTFYFSLIATNVLGLSAQQVVEIVVQDNIAPEFLSTPPVFAVEDELFIYPVEVIDRNGNEVDLSIEDQPTWLVYDAKTKILLGKPLNDCVGTCEFTIVASDGKKSTEQIVEISILNVNDAPSLKGTIDDICFHLNSENSCHLFGLECEDIDANDQLNFSFKRIGAGDVSWLSYDAETMTLSGEPTVDDLGTYLVEFIATDLFGASASITFSLQVDNLTSVQTLDTGLFQVYPNPARTSIYFAGVNTDAYERMWITNMSGQVVLERSNHQSIGQGFDVSSLKGGVYIVHLTNGEGYFHQKIHVMK